MLALSTFVARTLDRPRINPAFPLTYRAAAADAARMAASPVVIARPVLVLAGYRAWAMMPRNLASLLRGLTGAPGSNFASLAYPWSFDIRAIAARAAAFAQRRWPDTAIDVVGVSMGGLVARAAAAYSSLRIARLFTMGTPHRGARLATHLRPDRAARAMRPGSEFLADLDRALPGSGYQLIGYARLHDTWVGASRTAPQGHHPHWLSGPRLLSHLTISTDLRIITDIARHLRGEPSSADNAVAPPCD